MSNPEPVSVILGKQPPFVRSFKVSPRRSNGKNEKEVVIEYVLLQENRSEFISSLPYTLAANSLTPLFSAEDIAAHGILSSAYAGLDLQGVQESGVGRLRTLTITYATPQDTTDTPISWWSSSSTGPVYHERARISIGSSQSYATNALTPKHGLSPNGANISPDSDGTHATYEASWGPGDESEFNPDSETGEESTVDTIAICQSTEAVIVTDECLAISKGLFRGDMTTHGVGYITKIAAMVEAGQLTYVNNEFTGTSGWFYNSQDPANMCPYEEGYGITIDEACDFAKAINSKPTVTFPKVTVTVRRFVKSTSAQDLADSAAKIGTEYEEINANGISLQAPKYTPPAPFQDCPVKTVFVYGGKSIDPAAVVKRYTTGGTVKIHNTYVSETWTTKTTFADQVTSTPSGS